MLRPAGDLQLGGGTWAPQREEPRHLLGVVKLIWHLRGAVCGWGFVGVLSVSIVNELQGSGIIPLEGCKGTHDEYVNFFDVKNSKPNVLTMRSN